MPSRTVLSTSCEYLLALAVRFFNPVLTVRSAGAVRTSCLSTSVLSPIHTKCRCPRRPTRLSARPLPSVIGSHSGARASTTLALFNSCSYAVDPLPEHWDREALAVTGRDRSFLMA
jgi:hypothetical protein